MHRYRSAAYITESATWFELGSKKIMNSAAAATLQALPI